jgi:hypothetical protein
MSWPGRWTGTTGCSTASYRRPSSATTVGGVPSVYYGDEHAFRGVKEDRAGGDDAIRPAFGLRRRHPGAGTASAAGAGTRARAQLGDPRQPGLIHDNARFMPRMHLYDVRRIARIQKCRL